MSCATDGFSAITNVFDMFLNVAPFGAPDLKY